MTLTVDNIPNQMSSLATDMRERALDLGNALLNDRYDTRTAIAIAVENAKSWAEKTPDAPPGQHVVPHPDGWAVIRTDGRKPTYVVQTKREAIEKARRIARHQESALIIHGQDGWIQEKHSYAA
jgi:uncharacterized protein YdaT